MPGGFGYQAAWNEWQMCDAATEYYLLSAE